MRCLWWANFDCMDFELSPAEMEAIRSLDLGHGLVVNFSDPQAVLGLFEIIRQYKV